MISVTDIKGIGPSTAETLEEEGYDSVEALANADQDELGAVNGVGDDRALEYIVGAADLLEEEGESQDDSEEGEEFDLTPSELPDERDEDEDEENEETEEPDADAEGAEDDESDESSLYDVTITFNERLSYDVYHAALMRHHERVYTSHQPTADAMQKLIDGLTDVDSVEYELDELELNTLHTAIKQTRNNYQGDNLIDHMDALVEIEEQVDDYRREYLF